MDELETIAALAALAQATRLQAFRALVQAEPDGIAAGDLAQRLGVPQNTLSAHLTVLSQAGLVTGLRQGRSIVYHANPEQLRQMMLYLLKDCCGGKASLCEPLIAELTGSYTDTCSPACALLPDSRMP
ncbi:helix-turn-helix transcriptional regulator [Pannonibacter sp. P2PFMT1]|uniref:ArsR/SmtB family transcription factor n=1 Tax=Pannonibacter sp. P2PFMT1 TaxID=2003582 RepID=UPI0016480842|nr:metalloregulator ArsR/SmtB family transcription factor [Pannonibacter sp. P2PFMT1]